MALKTAQEIERDFYLMVKESALGRAVSGGIYRSEMRPNDSADEDIIVRFLSGTNGQIQRGVVILNVYVPDVPYLNDGRLVPNHARIAELQELVNEFLNSQSSSEYLIRPDETPRMEYVPELEQHFIYTRKHYERLSI